MVRIPDNLKGYVDYQDGVMVAVDLPDELKDEFERFREDVERATKDNPFTDF